MEENAKRLKPTVEVLRELYLKSGNQCAFPGCYNAMVDDNGNFIGQATEKILIWNARNIRDKNTLFYSHGELSDNRVAAVAFLIFYEVFSYLFTFSIFEI